MGVGQSLNMMMRDEAKKRLLYAPKAVDYSYTICGCIRLSAASLVSLLGAVALVAVALASTAFGLAIANTGSASSIDPKVFSPPPPAPMAVTPPMPVAPNVSWTCGNVYGKTSNERTIIERIQSSVSELTDGRVTFLLVDAEKKAPDVESGELDCVLDLTQNIGANNDASTLIGGGLAGAGWGLDQTLLHSFYQFDPDGIALYARLTEDKPYTSFLASLIGPEIFGWCKDDIADLAALQRKDKIRVPGGMALLAYRALMGNASKVTSSPPSIISGVDCFEWNSPAADVSFLASYNFDLKASEYKHVYIGGLHQNSMLTSLVVSDAAMAALTATDRAIVKHATQSVGFMQQVQRNIDSGQLLKHIESNTDGWNGFTVHTSIPGVNTRFKQEIKTIIDQKALTNTLVADLRDRLGLLYENVRAFRSRSIEGEAQLLSDAPTGTIGLFYDQSGDVAFSAPSFVEVFAIAIDNANVRYPSAGSAIRFIYFDSACNDFATATASASAALAAGVQIVVGPLCSSSAKAINTILAPAGVPMISYGATTELLSDDDAYPHFFRTVATDSVQSTGLADLMNVDNVTRACVLNVNNSYGIGFASSLISNLETHGVQIAVHVAIPRELMQNVATAATVQAQLEAINCNGIALLMLIEDAKEFVEAFAASSTLNELPLFGGDGLASTNSTLLEPLSGSGIQFLSPLTADGAVTVEFTRQGIYQNEAYEAVGIATDAIVAHSANPTAMSLTARVVAAGTGRTPSVLGTQFDFLPNGDYAGNGYHICTVLSDSTRQCTRRWTASRGVHTPVSADIHDFLAPFAGYGPGLADFASASRTMLQELQSIGLNLTVVPEARQQTPWDDEWDFYLGPPYYHTNRPQFAALTSWEGINMTADEFMGWYSGTGGKALVDTVLGAAGYVGFPAGNTPPQWNLYTSFPINSLDDLKGQPHMRAVGNFKDWLLTVDPYATLSSNNSNPETTVAEYVMPYMDHGLDWYPRMTHTYNVTKETRGTYWFLVKQSVWDTLSSSQQRQIEAKCLAAERAMMALMRSKDAEYLASNAVPGGIVRALPADVEASLASFAAVNTQQKLADVDTDTRAMMESMLAYKLARRGSAPSPSYTHTAFPGLEGPFRDWRNIL